MHAFNVIAFVYTFVAVLLPLSVGTWLALRGLRGGPDFPSCGK